MSEKEEDLVVSDQGTAEEDRVPGPPAQVSSSELGEVARLFTRLGFTAFGGPAAHIAIMRDEVVKRRKWLNDQQFLDLIGITNLIPGPNSTEMAIHLGLVRAGWPGFIVGGLGFILPAVLIVMGLAWAYVRFGSTPQAGWMLYGIKPVVMAIILQALWQLGKKALKGTVLAVIGVGAALLYFVGINELTLLFGGGLVYLLLQNYKRLKSAVPALAWTSTLGLPALSAAAFSYPLLFFSFLKIGAVLYGSGYVLLAFLKAEFVTRLGWLTEQQLLDAVAIGQVTPGPLFTTATFIGYLLGGVKGGILATLGIFLPSFLFVALSNRALVRFQESPVVRSLLDGVNAAALGLMAAVSWELGRASIIDPITVGLACLALLLLLRFRVNSTWLILGGAAAGWIVSLIR